MCGYLSTRWLFIYLSVHPVATINWFKYVYDICSVQHSRANRPVKTRPVKTWFLSITIEDHDLNIPCAAVFDKLKKAVQDYFNEGGQCPKKIGLTFTGAFRKILRERLTTEELEHVNSFFRESGNSLTYSSESLRTVFVNRNKDFQVEQGAFYNYHRAFKLANPQ